ncbi:MAG: PRC-barrel domain-containing protein [Candidatus Microsaccharimonas sp.]
MLIVGTRLLNTPVMSLQTGGRLAHTEKPIIDPSNLHIIAFEVDGPLLSERPALLRVADIREMGRVGMIINSNDEIIGVNDVIKIEKLYKQNFPLVGMAVIDDHKHRLGKVEDYTVDTDSFVIQQLTVKRGFFKGITDTGLLIGRAQIVEINDKEIVVKSQTIKSVEPVMQASRTEFVNPFRKSSPTPKPETRSQSDS